MRFFIEGQRRDLGDLTALKPVGSGGAGDVYVLPRLKGQCIKIYKRDAGHDHAREHEGKVRAMLANPPDLVLAKDGTVQMAWPQAIVVDESGDFRGFVMPFIDFKASWGMNQVLNPRLRRAKGIPDALVFRLTAACNLAFLLDSLHRAGHNIIDMKPQNMRIYGSPAKRAGFVALLDCDGFAVSEGPGGRTFPATLATPEYAHPRGIGPDGAAMDLDWVNANARQQDLWALAVLTFLLLNESHPLQGVPAPDFRDYPTDLPMLTRRHREVYAYGVTPNPRVAPKPDSLHDWFDRDLRDLFDRTFDGQLSIPAAHEWRSVLFRLLDGRQACHRNSDHWRLGPECGQCAREAQLQVNTPPSRQMAAPRPVRRLRPVPPPPPATVPGSPTATAARWEPYPMARALLVAMLACLPVGMLAGTGIALTGLPLPRALLSPATLALTAAGLLTTFGFLRGRLRAGAVRRGRPVRRASPRLWLGTLAAGALLFWTGLSGGPPLVLPLLQAAAGPAGRTAPAEASPQRAEQAVASRPSQTQIRGIQQELARLGLYAGSIDGISGPMTLDAVAGFARQQGMAAPALRTPDDAGRLLTLLQRQPTPAAPPARPNPPEPSPVPASLAGLGIEAASLDALTGALDRSLGSTGRPVPWVGGGQSGSVTALGPMADRTGCHLLEIARDTIRQTLIGCRRPDGIWNF